jgi:hypothetical protein
VSPSSCVIPSEAEEPLALEDWGGGGELPQEGVYEFKSSSGDTYVGQSSRIPDRIREHISSGKLRPEDLDTLRAKEVPGGKTAREIQGTTKNKPEGWHWKSGEQKEIGKGRQYLLP